MVDNTVTRNNRVAAAIALGLGAVAALYLRHYRYSSKTAHLDMQESKNEERKEEKPKKEACAKEEVKKETRPKRTKTKEEKVAVRSCAFPCV